MKRFQYQQRSVAAAMAGCEEGRMDSVICPKPRRLGILNPSVHDPISDSKAGADLLDIILAKGCYGGGEKYGNQVASSPPYFCGSPPSRASNPVIQDSQFGNEKIPIPPISPVAPPSPSSRIGGGCTRMKFGHIPAAVRIEGFDCLSRDRRSCSSISAVA